MASWRSCCLPRGCCSFGRCGGLLESRFEDLHEGAFAPFWQQPLLKALLLPFATLGGTTVLDYMALANL
ncbi:hypothetical protein WKW77_00495 [Variovorax ureilyticus]|uniref:Uncharacterized protein n=1 Tax=Variovorax ureilyticus TaxID=1836198 RepID=A0ABU8V9H4_9BURK